MKLKRRQNANMKEKDEREREREREKREDWVEKAEKESTYRINRRIGVII